MSLHKVTLVYEVEAESWDLAIEQVLRTGQQHLKDCTTKEPGRRRVYTPASTVRMASYQLKEKADG